MRKALPILFFLMTASQAQAGELFGGLYAHAVNTPLTLESDRESGVDFQLGARFGPLGKSPFEPYIFGALNSKGETSYAAAGLSARFGKRVFVRPGIGLAIHSGSTEKHDLPDRLALGSRILFEPELGVGVMIGSRSSLELSWVHLSHAQLFARQNPGIDNIGFRLTTRF